jgi:MoxR-like ATPase
MGRTCVLALLVLLVASASAAARKGAATPRRTAPAKTRVQRRTAAPLKAPASPRAPRLQSSEGPAPKPLVVVDPNTYEVKEPTDEGLETVSQLRDSIRERDRLARAKFMQLGTAYDAATLARIMRGNAFFYGPPGGAKSLLVDWMLQGEPEQSFQLQLHQMITEQAFTGGQDFRAAQRGEYRVNTKGSLGDHVVALIDEVDKGNPAALMALLSLLNERAFLLGNKKIAARIETVFATSNANLADILRTFNENGQGSAGPALLNRFQFKAFIYDWLPEVERGQLLVRADQEHTMEILAARDPALKKHEVFLRPKPVRWRDLEYMSTALVKATPLFMASMNQFVHDLRIQTNQAVKKSASDHRADSTMEPFIYAPAARHSNRLSLAQIPRIVKASAFLDFLRSPLADDGQLKANLARPLKLDPVSLWRAHFVGTTIGMGDARLKRDGDKDLAIDFGWRPDPEWTSDATEEKLIQHQADEQTRLQNAYRTRLDAVREGIALRARHDDTVAPLEEGLELQLLEAAGE